MPFDPSGRWVSVEQIERREARDESDHDTRRAVYEASRSYNTAADVRTFYKRLTAPIGTQVGPTSFDMGRGLSDVRAFDGCVEAFGFRNTMRALRGVSQRADLLHDGYQRARGKR